jgi:hypothetical protein
MRATILFTILITFLCQFSAHTATFIFNSGKSVQGEILFEDGKTIRIRESSGLDMTLRKSELNLAATRVSNVIRSEAVAESPAGEERRSVEVKPQTRRSVKVYTNRDARSHDAPLRMPQPETNEAWQSSVAKMEREFTRLQGACRGAGTGPNLSRVWRSHTYNVEGKQVRVTGYWADPANIEEAKQICARAIQAEERLQQARLGYRNFLEQRKHQQNSVTAQ